jgi:hypothetical protein
MAAPDSKPSSTNQPGIQEPSKEREEPNKAAAVAVAASLSVDPPGLKDPPPSSQAPPTPAAAASATATSSFAASSQPQTAQQPLVSTGLPTYESSETSENYVTGKELLAEGDFEQALAVIEDGIVTTSTLVESAGLDAGLHESMAPFHYLYGTTLLYSIEESNDSQQVTNTVDESGTGDNDNDNDNDNAEPDQHHQEEAEASAPAVASAAAAAASAASPSDPPDDDDNNQTSPADDNADDMQIAWENLEAARTIVELLLSHDAASTTTTTTTTTTMSSDRTNKIKLDLSQILLREGDLQRLNGRYADAIHDYQSCVDLRTQVLPDLYDRRIADAQCNLGLSYLTSASELQKEPSSEEEKQTMDLAVRLQLSEEHVQKGIQAYIECSKVLCGKIAILCGADPTTLLAEASNKQSAGFKTTGLDDDNDNTNGNGNATAAAKAPSDATLFLHALRKRVADLQPLEADDATVPDLRQVLDEIQETIDEVEPSQDAVRQASHLRVQAQQAALAADGQEVTDAAGVTTSIGFAPISTTTTSSTTTTAANPWAHLPVDTTKPAAAAGDAADAVAPAGNNNAKPAMPMLVKKKKKREPEGDSSQPSPEDAEEENAAKRSKTE